MRFFVSDFFVEVLLQAPVDMLETISIFKNIRRVIPYLRCFSGGDNNANAGVNDRGE
jgi:hypothetical protein